MNAYYLTKLAEILNVSIEKLVSDIIPKAKEEN